MKEDKENVSRLKTNLQEKIFKIPTNCEHALLCKLKKPKK